MNRAQRRAAAKNKGIVTEHLSEEEFQLKLRREAEKIANAALKKKMDAMIMETLESSMAATTAVLHEEYGFGAKRMQRFMAQYNSIFDRVLTGEIDLDDLKRKAIERGVNLGVEVQHEED